MNGEYYGNLVYLVNFEYDFEDWAKALGVLRGLGVLCELGALRALGALRFWSASCTRSIWDYLGYVTLELFVIWEFVFT